MQYEKSTKILAVLVVGGALVTAYACVLGVAEGKYWGGYWYSVGVREWIQPVENLFRSGREPDWSEYSTPIEGVRVELGGKVVRTDAEGWAEFYFPTDVPKRVVIHFEDAGASIGSYTASLDLGEVFVLDKTSNEVMAYYLLRMC